MPSGEGSNASRLGSTRALPPTHLMMGLAIGWGGPLGGVRRRIVREHQPGMTPRARAGSRSPPCEPSGTTAAITTAKESVARFRAYFELCFVHVAEHFERDFVERQRVGSKREDVHPEDGIARTIFDFFHAQPGANELCADPNAEPDGDAGVVLIAVGHDLRELQIRQLHL